MKEKVQLISKRTDAFITQWRIDCNDHHLQMTLFR